MLDEQELIESTMLIDTSKRMYEDNRKTVDREEWSDSKIGRMYTKDATHKFIDTVKEKLDSFHNKKHGAKMRALKLMVDSSLEPEVISHLFCVTLFNHLPLLHKKPLKRGTLAKRVGDCIHDELRLRFFAQSKNRKALLRKLFKDFDKRTYPREWRKRTIKLYFEAEQIDWTAWSDDQKTNIGTALLWWFRDATGLIECSSSSAYVEPHAALYDHVQKTMKDRVLDFMIYKPMVTPPNPWSEVNLFTGGYKSNQVRPFAVVKGIGKKDIPRLKMRDWSQIIPAVNALQETPWRVNKRMVEMLEWSFVHHQGKAKLPPADPVDFRIPRPAGYGEDEAITKAHNLVIFKIRSKNREIKSRRKQITDALSVAKAFMNYDAIYFPHNLDSRGRAYPIPAFLNPQMTESIKSLLEFSKGMPIDTSEQACWLAIAGANAYGKDKVSLQERADWVVDNEEMIFSIARDPKADIRWHDASEPFTFLRFCLEWSNFYNHGYGFISHMVCAVDATCSGIQNYSMAMADEIGGRSVNLVPGLTRQDIYQDVADKVLEKLMDIQMDAHNPHAQFARDWIKFGITRNTTKKPTMVLPYAATFSSCMAYTREWLTDCLEKEGQIKTWLPNTDNQHDERERVVMLSQLIWQSINETVIKAKEAMQWLSTAGREFAKYQNANASGDAYDKRLTWVTPDGFEVAFFRDEKKKYQIDTWLDGRVTTVLYKVTPNLSPADMALAVSPCWVHSLDANLMRASVVKGLERGIVDYAMVHDSFGVHACHMSSFLSSCVKPAFIEMYTKHDVLKEFADSLPTELNLPPLPQRGSLDLCGVQESEFFFS